MQGEDLRETKFRAYHKEEKKMCRIETLRPGAGAYLIGVMPNEDQILPELKMRVASPKDGRFCDQDEFVLMQYTGLKDKNGKEIYEGDIVRTHCFYQGLGENMGVIECEKEFISIVEYYQNDCAFVLVHTKDGDIYNFTLIEEPNEELEIIGNIYESSELLK